MVHGKEPASMHIGSYEYTEGVIIKREFGNQSIEQVQLNMYKDNSCVDKFIDEHGNELASSVKLDKNSIFRFKVLPVEGYMIR